MSAKKVHKVKKEDVYDPQDVRIPSKFGGGVLKELVKREIPSKKVTHYALAYINPSICGVDNGRVLGYDNSHGFAHKHFMGTTVPEPFTTYEELYDRFQAEWQAIAVEFVNGEKS
ncbi:MAG: hypothetical protein GZ085_13415 [Sulfuriferula multivorans]|uniref:Uncharacterized protein n=1 Tax=Sulfuriferula multivorans TaxID=1559896 RepID=A0A7C9P9E0_9PROT|nr:hypothetical protein [Sulfuriferula multivorans]